MNDAELLRIYDKALKRCEQISNQAVGEDMASSLKAHCCRIFLQEAAGMPVDAISDEIISSWPRMMQFVKTAEDYARGFVAMTAYQLQERPLGLAALMAEALEGERLFDAIQKMALDFAQKQIFLEEGDAPLEPDVSRAGTLKSPIPADATKH
jgi:hypothetical protein